MEISSYLLRGTQSEVFIDWDEKEYNKKTPGLNYDKHKYEMLTAPVSLYIHCSNTQKFPNRYTNSTLFYLGRKNGIPRILRRVKIKEMTECPGKWPRIRKPMVRQTSGNWKKKKVGQTR